MIRVFCSYAHEDVGQLRTLVDVYLKPLRREQLISHWDDRQIVAGRDGQQVIDRRLEEADLVLLLISNHFIASDYATGVEVARAMERCRAGSARVSDEAVGSGAGSDGRCQQFEGGALAAAARAETS